MNVILPANQWIDLYSATGISSGAQLTAINLTSSTVRMSSTESEPTPSDDHIPLSFGSKVQNTAGDPGAWAMCVAGGGVDVVGV